ncbi:MAG: DUF421 domain-containing protein [Clostridia bacterium]|nr:DUF421 domain-containing protein [Clostridia bacterium]
MDPVLRVAVFSVSSFLFLFVITKIMGKKQIAQLSFLDYVIGISLGSIAAEMSTDPERPFYHFFIAMTIYLVLDLILTFLARKAIFLKKFVRGRPIVLIESGKINYGNLSRSKLDINDLLSMCRAKGYFDLRSVAYCIFETSGEVSILPARSAVPAKSVDLGAVPPEPSLSKDVIEDGRIIEKALRQIGKDEAWLKERLGISDESEIKKIALATYYEDTKELMIHYKDA